MPRPRLAQPRRPATRDGLLLWVIHRFSEALADHAVLKEGMALRLLDCPRRTNDLDYVFVPYDSKKTILPIIERVLAGLEGAAVTPSLNSKAARFEVRLDSAAIQVEVSVDTECDAIPVATAALAAEQAAPSQVVRIMAPDVALAHKLAAWNERRLLRDLYDAYFLSARVRARPSRAVLKKRLANVQSRIPRLRKRKSMTLESFLSELDEALATLTDEALAEELAGLLEASELPGLALRIRSGISRLGEELRQSSG